MSEAWVSPWPRAVAHQVDRRRAAHTRVTGTIGRNRGQGHRPGADLAVERVLQVVLPMGAPGVGPRLGPEVGHGAGPAELQWDEAKDRETWLHTLSFLGPSTELIAILLPEGGCPEHAD